MTGPILQVYVGCDFCDPDVPTRGRLFAEIGGRRFCSKHWFLAGHPWPRDLPTPDEVHLAEIRTRERMLARGGAFRHLVRSGKS